MSRPLNVREAAFVLHFRGRARGNATKAALLAGYARGSARVTASRLLTKANIRAALAALAEKAEQQGKAHAEERDLICSTLARDPRAPAETRLAAIKELNKVDGRHTHRHQIEGKVTLEQALAASRAGDEP